MTCVYEHKRTDTGDTFYVGKGVRGRPYQSGVGRRSAWWCRVVEKAGGFVVRIIADEIDDELACLLEIERINQLRRLGANLCNLTDGGDGTAGHKRSEEWRSKMSAVHKGKTISAETRKKISDAVKLSGYKATQETREKISAANRGHKRNVGRKQPDSERSKRAASLVGNKSRLGQKRSAAECAATSAALLGVRQKVLVCPHCRKSGGNSMKRWHFEFCLVKRDGSDTDT